jgi:hypothetical protein
MGNSNSLSVDSFLDRHACSGRNITWHYIHGNGNLPSLYRECQYTPEILRSNCCFEGSCRPFPFVGDFYRYQWYDWDGLGDPYDNITNSQVGHWGSHSWWRKWLCMGVEASSGLKVYHKAPLGCDGLPVSNPDIKLGQPDPACVLTEEEWEKAPPAELWNTIEALEGLDHVNAKPRKGTKFIA